MVTRQIFNTGNPFLNANNIPVGGMVIQFQLIDSTGQPADVFDRIDGDYILPGIITAVTASISANGLNIGEFVVDLWPTDRGDRELMYAVRILGAPGTRSFIRPLPSGDGSDMAWYTFLTGEFPGQRDTEYGDGTTITLDDGMIIEGG